LSLGKWELLFANAKCQFDRRFWGWPHVWYIDSRVKMDFAYTFMHTYSIYLSYLRTDCFFANHQKYSIEVTSKHRPSAPKECNNLDKRQSFPFDKIYDFDPDHHRQRLPSWWFWTNKRLRSLKSWTDTSNAIQKPQKSQNHLKHGVEICRNLWKSVEISRNL
jgi:hypothetical protein